MRESAASIRRFWHAIPEWMRDTLWPSVTPFTEAEREREEEQQLRLLEQDEEHIRRLQVPAGSLTHVLDTAKIMLRAEFERRSSIEARLTTILGMASIASAIAFGVLTLSWNGPSDLASSWQGIIGILLLVYSLAQLICAVLASIRGLRRTGYETVRVGDMIPLKGEDDVTTGRRVLTTYVGIAAQHHANNSIKVEHMAVAHRSLQNFIGGALVLTCWIGFQLITGIASKPTAEETIILGLRSDPELIELLRGPRGPAGPRGEVGPQGPTGPPGQIPSPGDAVLPPPSR